MAKTRPGVASKIKPGRKELDSYTIKGTNKIVKGSLISSSVVTCKIIHFSACFGSFELWIYVFQVRDCSEANIWSLYRSISASVLLDLSLFLSLLFFQDCSYLCVSLLRSYTLASVWFMQWRKMWSLVAVLFQNRDSLTSVNCFDLGFVCGNFLAFFGSLASELWNMELFFCLVRYVNSFSCIYIISIVARYVGWWKMCAFTCEMSSIYLEFCYFLVSRGLRVMVYWLFATPCLEILFIRSFLRCLVYVVLIIECQFDC